MIVVDASVLANALADDGAAGVHARAALLGEEASAPDLVDVETAAVLRRRWLARDLTENRFEAAIEDLTSLPLQRFPTGMFLRRAFELRANITAYHATYVGLAELLSCTLLTGDGRLARASGPRCQIRLLT